jgi:hypothetical protein
MDTLRLVDATPGAPTSDQLDSGRLTSIRHAAVRAASTDPRMAGEAQLALVGVHEGKHLRIAVICHPPWHIEQVRNPKYVRNSNRVAPHLIDANDAGERLGK